MSTRREKDQWLDEKDRREGLKSLYYFGKFILGFDLEEVPHREVCDFVQDSNPLSLMLLPRGSFKTTVVSQIYPVWLIVKNPNIRILLDSIVLRNSERNLDVVKSLLTRNPRLRHLFGDFVDKNRWTQSSITVSKRTNYKLRDPSVGTSSVDTLEVGPHWDVIIPDDLHNEDNSKTKEQIDKVYEHWRLLFSLLEPHGTMRMVGTRWADLDIYGRILERHKRFKTMVRRAESKDGSLYFPTRFTRKVLQEIRDEEGPEMYSAQYLNDPVPQGEDAFFQKHWFKYAEAPADISLFITVDPALGTGPDNDYTSFAVGGISRNNDLYIVDYQFGRWHPFESIERLFKLYDKYRTRIRGIGIETNAFQKMYKFTFDAEMRKRNKFVNVVELRHQKSKMDRILQLQPRYKTGAVIHAPWMRDGELEEELLRHPRARHDDVADSVASLLEIIKPRASIKPKKQVGQKDRREIHAIKRLGPEWAKYHKHLKQKMRGGWHIYPQ